LRKKALHPTPNFKKGYRSKRGTVSLFEGSWKGRGLERGNLLPQRRFPLSLPRSFNLLLKVFPDL
jgi:hypothetical protein